MLEMYILSSPCWDTSGRQIACSRAILYCHSQLQLEFIYISDLLYTSYQEYTAEKSGFALFQILRIK